MENPLAVYQKKLTAANGRVLGIVVIVGHVVASLLSQV
jgi:hypothetical protein